MRGFESLLLCCMSLCLVSSWIIFFHTWCYGTQNYISQSNHDRFPEMRRVVRKSSVDGSLKLSIERLTKVITKGERELAQILFTSVRIICMVLSRHDSVDKRQAIIDSWGPRCNVLLFVTGGANVTNQKQLRPRVVLVQIAMPELYARLWMKTRLAFEYVVDNYSGQYDWILKVDDDSFVYLENLRLYLSSKSQDEKAYHGLQYKTMRGYCSGGPGYVLSRHNAKQMVAMFKGQHLRPKGSKPLGCRHENASIPEDVEISRCLRKLDIVPADSRDDSGRFRWSPFDPQMTLFPDENVLGTWFPRFSAHELKQGYECCSDSFVSFHYVRPEIMKVMEYLTYYVHPFSDRSVWNYDQLSFE